MLVTSQDYSEYESAALTFLRHVMSAGNTGQLLESRISVG